MHNEADIRIKLIKSVETYIDEIDYMMRKTISLENCTTEELLSFDKELAIILWKLMLKNKT